MKIISKKGFTLVEILIVIVIIGILSVLLIPQMLSAPARARDRQRVSDVKAIASYYQDTYLANPAVVSYPATGCITKATFTPIISTFGGRIPVDTKWAAGNVCTDATLQTGYYFHRYPASSPYKFAVSARVEDPARNGNSTSVNPASLSAPGSNRVYFVVPVQK